MEGHLIIRHWGGRLEKVWVILDGQQVTCYERFDVISQDPINVKKVLNIRNAKIVKLTNDPKAGKRDTKFGISVTWNKSDGTKKITLFDCADASAWSQWFDALEAGALAHEEEERHHALPRQHASLLGLEDLFDAGPTALTKAEISRAYKKLCLKAHPDRGGDVDEFNRINLAYNWLLNFQSEQEELDNSIPIDYEVCIEKAGAGIGLGLNVSYDQVRRQVVVKSVNPKIMIKGISEESGGHILAGDALIAIDRDDSSNWKLSRIKARLNAFRLPVGSDTHLTLERRVPKPEGYDESQAHLVHPSSTHVLRPVPEGENVASLSPVLNEEEDDEEDEAGGDNGAGAGNEGPFSPGTTVGREEAHLFPDDRESQADLDRGEVREAGDDFSIDEEIRHFTESEDEEEHQAQLQEGEESELETAGGESEPYVEVEVELDRMRQNDSPNFGGRPRQQAQAQQGQVDEKELDTNQLNDQFYDLDESYYVPVPAEEDRGQVMAKGAQQSPVKTGTGTHSVTSPPVRKLSTSGRGRSGSGSSSISGPGQGQGQGRRTVSGPVPVSGARGGRGAALPANDSDSDVFYAVETGLVPTPLAPYPAAPQQVGRAIAQRAVPVQHQVAPSNTYDREINAILQSTTDPK
jgi:hypothetical protein